MTLSALDASTIPSYYQLIWPLMGFLRCEMVQLISFLLFIRCSKMGPLVSCNCISLKCMNCSVFVSSQDMEL